MDIDGSDGTGTLNDDTDPYPSIQSAMDAIDAANGDLDYATIYLVEDVYDSNNRSAGTTDTVNEWVTIAGAPGENIDNIIIDEDGSLWNTNYIKFSGVTLRGNGGSDFAVDQAGAWADGCKMYHTVYGQNVSAPCPFYTTAPLAGLSSPSGYITSSYITQCSHAVYSVHVLVRGLKIENIYDDAVRRQYLVINCHIDGVYGAYTGGFHSDIFQTWGTASLHDNILYNLYVTDSNYQSLFLNESVTNTGTAFVNVFIETRTDVYGGEGGVRFYGVFEHLLMWHCTFASAIDDSQISLLWLNDGTGFGYDDSSFIGNLFQRFDILESYAPDGTAFLDSGNNHDNEANYNHYRYSSSDPGENTSTGIAVIDLDTPGSATYGYPIAGTDTHNRMSSNLTGVLCDARGNPRDSNPDIGALELTSLLSSDPLSPTNLRIMSP